MMYCLYFQAEVVPKDTWFLVAVLRSFEHLQFDRTYDTQKGIFEFLVPESNEHIFLEIMHYFQSIDIVSNLQKLDNRLLMPGAQV